MKIRKKDLKKKMLVLSILIVFLMLFFYWQNNDITVNHIKYVNSKIPDAFQGSRILQVSDLHNKEFGSKQLKLIRETTALKPDIIVVTGDSIDANRPNLDTAMEYLTAAVKIAPVYFVTGNHEKWSGLYEEFKARVEKAGVIILNNKSTLLKKGNDTIALLGMEDPDFLDYEQNSTAAFENILAGISKETSGYFQILLSHRPEFLSVYADQNIDLAFCGHAHGGQFRFPSLGGFYAPGQGFFPKYTSGMVLLNNTSMVISRGLGNSVIPVRIFNRPELVLVTLNNK